MIVHSYEKFRAEVWDGDFAVVETYHDTLAEAQEQVRKCLHYAEPKSATWRAQIIHEICNIMPLEGGS